MFLVDKFQQFYVELLRLRELVDEGRWTVVDGEVTPAGDPEATAEASPSAVWHKLHSLLKRQAAEAQREGGDVGQEVYRLAQFAMAALADEVFLHLEWAGKQSWREHLLESKLFNSHTAGEELFKRIDKLLTDRDGSYNELARVYLMTLALGFEGKYRGSVEAAQEIEAYRRRLHRFIFNRDPLAIKGRSEIVPQAYESTLDEARPTALPYMRPWIFAIVLILIAWIGVGHLIWINAIADIQPDLDTLLRQDSAASVHAMPKGVNP
jgi:type VI secretion system protein ImpK